MSLFAFDQRPIRLSVFGKTDVGRKRSNNQDSFLIADLGADGPDALRLEPDPEPLCPPATTPLELGPKGLLAVVADGMGGAAAGGVASRLAVSSIHRELVSRWGPDRLHTPQQFAFRLREAVEIANARVHEASQQNAEYRGMGTTVTAVGVLESFLYLAQVGDSRAYLVRRSAIEQLTRDQSLVQQLVDSGAITAEQAAQSDYSNVILQAVGPRPTVDVELSFQELRRGDLVILCSDGLTRMVSDEEIAETARSADDPACICTELVERANARGGPDNITVLALYADGDGLSDPQPTDRVGHNRLDVPR